ncbi:hypothetical protein [Staphylococcus phage vB_SsapH-Golestan-100]|nr:hypothetical protein [Staphylococcus phage vB_SsapH-Golestan-100]
MSLVTVIVLTVVIAMLLGLIASKLILWFVDACQRDENNITEIRVVLTLLIVSLGVDLAFAVDGAVRIQNRILYFL